MVNATETLEEFFTLEDFFSKLKPIDINEECCPMVEVTKTLIKDFSKRKKYVHYPPP